MSSGNSVTTPFACRAGRQSPSMQQSRWTQAVCRVPPKVLMTLTIGERSSTSKPQRRQFCLRLADRLGPFLPPPPLERRRSPTTCIPKVRGATIPSPTAVSRATISSTTTLSIVHSPSISVILFSHPMLINPPIRRSMIALYHTPRISRDPQFRRFEPVCRT